MKPFRWVLAAAVVTSLLVTVVPWLMGPVQYDALVAVNLVMTIAVIATAIYAAANLSEFRKARDAEYTPILDILVRTVRERGRETSLLLEVRNIGRGAAAGLEVAVWQTDKDQVIWLPERVPIDRNVLMSGESTSGVVKYEWLHSMVQRHFTPGLPDLIVEVRYRDALTPEVEQFMPYDHPSDDEEAVDMSLLRPSRSAVPKELRSVEAKQRMLEEVLDRCTRELGLTELGLKAVGKATRKAITVRVLDGDKELWRGQIGPNEAVYHLVEWIEHSASDLRAAHAEVAGLKEVPQAQGLPKEEAEG